MTVATHEDTEGTLCLLSSRSLDCSLAGLVDDVRIEAWGDGVGGNLDIAKEIDRNGIGSRNHVVCGAVSCDDILSESQAQ